MAVDPKNAAPAEAPVEASPAQEDLIEKWLETATPEQILKYRKIGGIVGQREQTARERARRDVEIEQAAIAQQQAQAELDRLATEDPDEFARRYLTSKEQARIQQQTATLRSGIREEYARYIGDGVRQLAEFAEITPEEFGKLQSSMAGKSDQEALAAFNATVIDIVADRRANKRTSEWRAKELAKEREAIRTELAAAGLQSSERPDLRSGSQPAPFDPTKLSPKDFDAWYRKDVLGRV